MDKSGKAKLDFLKENKDNGLSHPYYWSGFVVSGKTSAVVDNNASIWYALIAAAIIICGGLFFRRKRS